MPVSKLHLEKQFLSLLEGHSSILVLGPLDIDPKFLKKLIRKSIPDFLIFIDGGLRHKSLFSKKELTNSLSVGDGDSLLDKENGSIDILLPIKKDYSDLAYVLNGFLKLKTKISRLNFLGFSTLVNEERIDHLIFNLSEIERIVARLNLPINMDGRFLFLPPGKHGLSYRGLFSVMSFSGTEIRMMGKCEFQLHRWTKLKRLSSLGLSNRGSGCFEIECKKVILVYLAGLPSHFF